MTAIETTLLEAFHHFFLSFLVSLELLLRENLLQCLVSSFLLLLHIFHVESAETATTFIHLSLHVL